MAASDTVTRVLARWCADTPFDGIPGDVLASTRLRILDTLGLGIAGAASPIGRALSAAVGEARCPQGGATVLAGPAGVPAQTAAFANGALAEALDFGDSHNETVVHVSSPVVAAALAAAEARGLPGPELLRIVALASELTCRVALGAPGAFHARGFHPTGIFGAFGAAAAAALARRLDARRMADALGIAGGFAAGLLESWADGTWAKAAQPGWGAMAGVLAADLAHGGLTGPGTVIEGRAGVYASHVQGAAAPDFARIAADLGRTWENREISFKPYPNAHIMHGVIDAAFDALRSGGFGPGEVESVDCLVAGYMVDTICEPRQSKQRPATPAQARISAAHSVAELFCTGRMDLSNYTEASLADPAIRALAARIGYEVQPQWTGRKTYPGGVRVRLRDGRTIERIAQANLGSRANPMTRAAIEAKFHACTAALLPRERADAIVAAVFDEDGPDARGLMRLAAAV
ncbi:MmgE/PrpD family protein [Pigmentiphaga soli]|uniref:MmgE/PrpD family protein n=1 Tax=Pigmentiphaga soli TaxID=1007095 RepID=A0ABP8HAA9_9BURK